MMMNVFHPFGLCLAGAAVIALLLAVRTFRLVSPSAGALSWVACLAIPLGVIGGRVAYFLADFDRLSAEGLSFLTDFSRGGFMLYGALAGVVLAVAITSRITKAPFAEMADALCVPGLVMIALGRLAIGLTTGQDYGWCIEDWFMEDSGMSCFVLEDPSFLYRLPFGIPDYYENYNWAVFVFEALVAVVLAVAVGRVKFARPGGRAVLALTGYAAMQALCESMRQDAVLRWGFVRVNMIVGGILVLGMLILCFIHSERRHGRKMALCTGTLFLCALVVIAMEFALEKKISAIEWMPMDICYLLMGVACVGMIASVRPIWRDAFVTTRKE